MTPFLSPGEGGAKTHRNLDNSLPNTFIWLKVAVFKKHLLLTFFPLELSGMHLKLQYTLF